jgi:chromate transporter
MNIWKSDLSKLKEVGWLFLKLGTFSFGGPAAHIAMMEKEVVVKKQWISRESFLDLVGATNLIPGPNSTEMAIHCGYKRAGFLGLWVAGISFILPAALITGIFAWFYKQYGSLPAIEPVFYGIKPVVIVIILDAIFKFGKKALKNWQLGIIGIAVILGVFREINEITLLLLAGFIGIVWFQMNRNKTQGLFPLMLMNMAHSIPSITSWKLFWAFLKIGSVLFGSGYVLFAYLDGELVQKLGILSHQQLMDAIAIGQFTPGPVLSSATFIGYQIGGISGALWATLGIFLPSFFFVFLLNPIIPKLRKSQVASAFLDSVNMASVALMLAVVLKMGHATLIDWKSWGIAILSAACLYRFKKLNIVWLLITGAAVGWLLGLIS